MNPDLKLSVDAVVTNLRRQQTEHVAVSNILVLVLVQSTPSPSPTQTLGKVRRMKKVGANPQESAE